jgi:hypothetical protein
MAEYVWGEPQVAFGELASMTVAFPDGTAVAWQLQDMSGEYTEENLRSMCGQIKDALVAAGATVGQITISGSGTKTLIPAE